MHGVPFALKDIIDAAQLATTCQSRILEGNIAREDAEVMEVDPPALREYADCNRVILLSKACAVHERWLRERPAEYGELTRERLLAGAFLRAVDYVQATRMRRVLSDAMHAALAGVDAAICVSSHDPPCRLDDAQENARTCQRQARAPFNLTGPPAVRAAVRLQQRRPADRNAGHRARVRRGDRVPHRACVRAGQRVEGSPPCDMIRG